MPSLESGGSVSLMNQHVKRLAEEIRKLDAESRAALVEEVLAGLHEDDGAWDRAWAELCEARWRRFQDGGIEATSAEDVLAGIGARLQKRRAR